MLKNWLSIFGENSIFSASKKSSPGWMDGWVDGWQDGWVEAKAGLKIAYSNKKFNQNLIFLIRFRTSDLSCCNKINRTWNIEWPYYQVGVE